MHICLNYFLMNFIKLKYSGGQIVLSSIGHSLNKKKNSHSKQKSILTGIKSLI